MPDQTAAIDAAPDQTSVHATDAPEPQAGPSLMTADDAEVVRAVRTAYPDWQTKAPTLSEVRSIAGGGQTRAIRIRSLVQTADIDGQTVAPVVQSAPKVKKPKPAQTATPAEPADRVQVSAPKAAVPVQIPPPVVQTPTPRRSVNWPVLAMTAPAFVAIWSGWVGVGGLTGFGVVHPLPGVWDSLAINTAITLPIGMEVYAAYALWVWLSGRGADRARKFAKRSAIGALVFGASGQVAYHLMAAAGMSRAPWPITTAVACIPVIVLGLGAALAHLNSNDKS